MKAKIIVIMEFYLCALTFILSCCRSLYIYQELILKFSVYKKLVKRTKFTWINFDTLVLHNTNSIFI